MSRVKRGMMHSKRRKNILKKVRGYKHGRKNLIKLAQTAIIKAGVSAFTGRKLKKRAARQMFSIRINAALRPLGGKYSSFIHQMKVANVNLDRKVLSQLAEKYPAVFTKVYESVK